MVWLDTIAKGEIFLFKRGKQTIVRMPLNVGHVLGEETIKYIRARVFTGEELRTNNLKYIN